MKKVAKVAISYGVLFAPISRQLKKQGFRYDKSKVETFEKERDAINRLRFGNNLLTDSMAIKLIAKLHNKIIAHVSNKNNIK